MPAAGVRKSINDSSQIYGPNSQSSGR